MNSMNSGARSGRYLAALTLAAAISLGAGGCRTGHDDIERWGTTANGPRKLVAVLNHGKYDVDLRVDAAVGLVKMKPRSGKRVGIEMFTDTLANLPPADRSKIVAKLVPILLEEMKKPLGNAQAGQAAPDSTIPYKDASFALISQKDSPLVADDALKAALSQGLADWAAAAFPERLEDSSQMYAMEQVLRLLKAQGVKGLAPLIVPGGKKLDRIAELIAELGDDATKGEASKRLVDVAKDLDSDAWYKAKEPLIVAENGKAGYVPCPGDKPTPNGPKCYTKAGLKSQIDDHQDAELTRVFGWMKKVGGGPTVDFLLAYAGQNKPEKRRAAALSALEGKLDKNNSGQVNAVLAIASANDTPDLVRQIALARVGEMPRALVVERLYSLFAHENWKVRWVAAELVLKMSDATQLDEFFAKLSKVEHMSLTEPLMYGLRLKDIKGASDAVDKYASSGAVQTRLVALGYYYNVGTAAQLGKVEPYAKDGAKVPECKEDQKDCEWKCTYGEGDKKEPKEVHTLGDYVTYCVKPAMSARK